MAGRNGTLVSPVRLKGLRPPIQHVNRLGFAVAAQMEPDILLIDDPCCGLCLPCAYKQLKAALDAEEKRKVKAKCLKCGYVFTVMKLTALNPSKGGEG